MSENPDPLAPKGLGKLRNMMQSYVEQHPVLPKGLLRKKDEPAPLKWCPVCKTSHSPKGLLSADNDQSVKICDDCNGKFDQGQVAICCEELQQTAFAHVGREVPANPSAEFEGRSVLMVSAECMDQLMAEAQRQKAQAQEN